jgi:hypothetical protein
MQRTRIAGMVLAGLWILLLAVYSAPLWYPAVSWDVAISVEPPGRMWMVAALAAVVLLLPPVLLSIATRRWLRRRRA